MPCTAKKFEVERDDQSAAGVPDVDIALTTRELARLINRAHINFALLPDEEFDPLLGEATGAGVIFGATGGVMEAALRTAADTLEGKSLDSIEYHEIRGTQGYKEATYKVAGMDVNVAVVSGLKNADELLKKIKNGEANYHFVEVMCCPGGCVNEMCIRDSYYSVSCRSSQCIFYKTRRTRSLFKGKINKPGK